MGFFDFMQEAIAIDLGTANTLIIHNDKVVVDAFLQIVFKQLFFRIIKVVRGLQSDKI